MAWKDFQFDPDDPDPNKLLDLTDVHFAGLDSRLRPCERHTFRGPTEKMGIVSKIYCLNCGADGGIITEAWADKVIYLCNACEKHGRIPGLVEVPAEHLAEIVQERK